MCGICGFSDSNDSNDLKILDDMITSLNHRGPDDKGCDLFDVNDTSVGLGHARLSILDLSSAGHQPMHYKHLSIVLNGEIYNFKEIREELNSLDHDFVSDSDTEVILHAYEEWGIKCVDKFIGMFAFVILNKNTHELIIVRDRGGVKPLYYYNSDDLFMFASELKAFHKHPRFVKKINKNAVHQFMDYGFIPSPFCIFEKCSKLEPGHYLTFSIENKTIQISKYWDVNDYYRLPTLNIPYTEAKIEVENILKSAFEYRMVSDVPVGMFLSGGYDSTAVTAMLQKNRTERLNTFTIGFEEGNNEAPFAKEIANYLGTNHTEYYCTTKEAQEIVSDLPFYYDEPFADSSAIPTMLVSKMAKRDVTVALSADAGDEIFAGYTYYESFLRSLAFIDKIPEISWKLVSSIASVLEKITSNHGLKYKFNVLSDVLKTDRSHVTQVLQKNIFTKCKYIRTKLFIEKYKDQETVFNNDFKGFHDNLSIALANDYGMYLQNDILTKVDRATMSVALEGREPFLDHRIIEFAAQLPIEYKYGETQKMILRDIVHNYIPKRLMDRPKSGFVVPIYSWLKKDLRDLLEDNLRPSLISEAGIFNPDTVNKIKEDFLEERLDDPTIIWKLLQFQMWYLKWMS